MKYESSTAKKRSVQAIWHLMITAILLFVLVLPTKAAFADEEDGKPIETRIDFTVNGESFTDVRIGDVDETVFVSENFNMEELTEFYVTRIEMPGVGTYTYESGEYSLDMLDSQNRTILESRFIRSSDTEVMLRVESHTNDILDKDIANGKTRDDYCGFFITNLKLVKTEANEESVPAESETHQPAEQESADNSDEHSDSFVWIALAAAAVIIIAVIVILFKKKGTNR